jgi:UDP-GlcNAc:undecaprenyl-phosphate GlcNAc-1-phosphate transferase
MGFVEVISCGLLGGLVSGGVIWLIRRRWLVQAPGEGGAAHSQFHHTHDHPVPRLGGLALAASFITVVLAAWLILEGDPFEAHLNFTLVWGALAMFAVGLYDDFRPLGAKKKLALQVLISALVCLGGVAIRVLKNPVSGMVYDLGGWGVLATVVWLVALTNLINLIDGIDGLAGGISLMLMALLAYVSFQHSDFLFLLTTGMAGALLAFLHFNFPPARIYMGDGGAYFLGFLIGGMTIVSTNKGTIAAALLAPIFALGLPIIDTALAIVRRGLKGLPLFRPDRKHIHHRLVQSGLSRRRAVLTLYALSLIFLVMAFGVFWSQGRLMPVIFGATFLALAVAARSFGFIPDWPAMGKVVGNSLQMRKETRYALALTTWFELEAERCHSVAELWENFQFVARKLGLSHVRLVLEDKEETWRANCTSFEIARGESYHHQTHHKKKMILELIGNRCDLSEKLFEHLAELAAESWFKGAQHWHTLNHLPVRFGSALSSEKRPSAARGRGAGVAEPSSSRPPQKK